MPQLWAMSIGEVSRLIHAREVSPIELIESHLERIETTEGRLNSFITVLAEEATELAIEATQDVSNGGELGPLHGIPIGLKDLYDTAGTTTTVGSQIYRDRIPGSDATVVTKLRKAGAIIIGKLQMHEFALGATSVNPHYGPARNPWDLSRITGGSSGGSGSSVASGQCMGALGTDTGGSIRIPAGLCGIVGLKPTFGRVSRHGVFPLSWTMDTVGPMTRTVEDSATLLSATAGFDPLDPGSANVPIEDFAVNIGKDVSKMKIGVPQEYFYDIISEEVAGAVQAAQEVFLGLGAKVESISIPSLTHSLAISGTIMLAEAASVHEENLKERASQIGDDVRLRLTQGALLSASDYLKAQRARTEFNKQVNQILQQFDVLLSPTIAVGAPKIDEKTVLVNEAEHPALALMPRLTRPHNICGIPTISIPCGFTREGMPIGLQLAGRAFAEKDIIQAAYAYENATNWSTVRPQL